MKRIISISNRKGGSGKTTTAVNISAALAHKGKRVLVVDADPQAHTTLSFGISKGQIEGDLYSVLMGQKSAEEVMVNTYLDKLNVIPSTRRLMEYERKYSSIREARMHLAECFSSINGQFDYTIFDTPPTLSLMTVSALIASDEVYIPMQAHFLALEGLAEMVTLISKIHKLYNHDVRLKGIIPTFYKEKTKLSQEVIEQIKKNLGEEILLHPVRVNIALAEAPGHGETIFQYRLKSHGAYDYLCVANQIEDLK